MSAHEIARDQLRSFVERIERLEEEKKAIADDIKDVYAEAKSNGYDVKVLREVVKIRKMDRAERAEFEAVLELYREALGDLADTPLGEAAVASAGKKAPPGFSPDETVAERIKRNAAKSRRDSALGVKVPLTDEEKASGVIAAFEDRDGHRTTVAPGGARAPAAEPDLGIPPFLDRRSPEVRARAEGAAA